MASNKVAVFMLLVAVLSRTAFSDCDSDCYDNADKCLLDCGGHSCASGCTDKLTACYNNCDIEAKRSRPREPYKKDDKGLYDIFQKLF